MEPLRVVAYTPAGFASSDQWSPSLDGILGYWQLREQLGEEEFALGMSGHSPMVEPVLPLARLNDGPEWFWAASAPLYHAQVDYLHYYHRRFDAFAAERYLATGKSGKILISAGPYKQYRQAHQVHVAPSVTWHTVGDRAEIVRLLRRCAAIGAGVSRGPGRVVRWEVTTDGADERMAMFHRPLPVAFAAAHGIDGPTMEWAIRPPGWARENRALCVMPR